MRGHIRPHGDGAWRLFVDAGTDPVTGKRRQVTKVVRGSRKAAETALARLITEASDGRHAGTSEHTFGQLLDAYLAHKSLSLEKTTADNYRWQLAYVPDRLRAMPVTRVGVEHLEALYLHLATRGRKRDGGPLSPKAVRNVHVVLHGAFELARRRRWVAVNPAADAEVPSGPRRLPSPAPAGAVGELLRAAAAEHEALPVYLRVTVCAGGRRSEVHGLRWSAVDFDRGVVVLRDTVVRAGGEWLVKARTKSGGTRPVVLDAGTLELLRAHHDRAFELALACEVSLPTDAFVFSDAPDGSWPWNPRTTAARFTRACLAAGLPKATRLHDLRHLMATHLIDQGVPIPVVSARLGHAQNSTTLDIYTGRVAASDSVAADVMGRLLDGLQE
jgi:integrase